jgi:lipopolysaccharide transport system ATP-binding protein
MKDKLLSLNDVSVRYRLRHSLFRNTYYMALKDISFDLYRGETLGVVGRNGAGKSTLLRILAGIYKPDKGSFVNHGVSASLLTFQIGFDPELNGRNNALLAGMLLGHNKREVKMLMDDIIEFSEIGEFIDQPVKTYSTGMMARLGFSVAITMKPDVLLIDEALGVGDASFRKKAEKVLKEKIQGEQTVVFVSHSAEQIHELCDRVLWVEHGEVKRLSNTQDVMSEYENF